MTTRRSARPRAMPPEQQEVWRQLQEIPNVGPAVAGALVRLGIRRLEDLAAREPNELYATLCRLDGGRHDPCMHDVLAAVVAYARGGPPQPWWVFSRERKAREQSVK